MSNSSLVEQGLFVWWITAQAGGGTSILMTYEATFDVKVSSLLSVNSPCKAQAKQSPSFIERLNTFIAGQILQGEHI